MIRSARSAFLAAFLGGALASVCAAADWPQWRGPQRDGVAVGIDLPMQWPAELKRGWQSEVGVGHSTPIVVGDRVIVFSRREENELVTALNLADGKQVWQQSYAAPYELVQVAAAHGKGPKSTPVAADGLVYTLGISGILSCWDLKTGKQVWQQEFSKQYPKTSPLYGTAMSPLVAGGYCVAHVGGHDQGALTAFDARTGKVAWTWNGDGPAYASPILVELSGAKQIVTQSQSACIGIDLAKGTLLWKIPYKTDYDQNSVTPVVYDESVVFSGVGRGVTRYRIEKQGDEWRTDEVWTNKEVALYMSSPLVIEDHLIGFSHRQKGQFFALDLATGKSLWTSDGRMFESASLVRTGNTIFALSTSAELIALRDSETQFQQLARYKVSDTPTWAHPVLVAGGVLIKDEERVTRWSWE